MRSHRRRVVPFIMSAVFTAVAAGCSGAASTEPAASAEVAGDAAAGQPVSAAGAGARITGIAFVDASTTSQGSRATLPAGAKVHPIGSTITGTEGCPTNRFGTDGLIVAVIDYTGRPTAGSLTITERQGDSSRARAPYYLDLNSGRTLQFLGPVVRNASYDLRLEYDLAQGAPKSATGQFVLARACAAPQ